LLTIREAVSGLLTAFDQISETHEEILDTDVREAMHHALNYYFVWGHDRSLKPRHYRMFTPDGNRLVAQAIERFLDSVEASGELSRVPPG
jgi:hypothetical protein